MSEKPARFEASVDTRFLYDRMKKAQIGETIPYEELSDLIKRDVRHAARGHMQSARTMCERDDGIVFEAVQNVGLRRIGDSQMVDTAQSSLDHIRRTSRRIKQRLASVRDFNQLPAEKRFKHNALMSLAGAIEAQTKHTAVAKVESAAKKADRQLPLAETLRLFSE